MWISIGLMAHAAGPKATCGSRTELRPVTIDPKARAPSFGVIHEKTLAADLGNGLLAELRYEHAYGATFVVLELRKNGEALARAHSWHMGQVFDLESPSEGRPVGSVGLSLKLDGMMWNCTALAI